MVGRSSRVHPGNAASEDLSHAVYIGSTDPAREPQDDCVYDARDRTAQHQDDHAGIRSQRQQREAGDPGRERRADEVERYRPQRHVKQPLQDHEVAGHPDSVGEVRADRAPDDPDQVWSEVSRILRRPGAFLFSTTSAISPFQVEIAGFPLFPWYPPPLQRRIMSWATEKRPALVGNTTRPAIHWFKHRDVRGSLHDAGFTEVVDRWQLRRGERDDRLGRVIDLAASNRAVRLAGDVAASGMEYLAIKR
jgi:hypothetical protein